MNVLVAAAKKEGQLSVVALPHDWVNYGEAIQKFSEKYGIKVNELSPDGRSGEEIEAIKANKDNKGPQAPDVIDVGLSCGPQAKTDGYWYGDYYGALAFEVNLDVVKNPPLDWPDLLLPAFKGQVALARALAVQPRVLLLDEPLSALDAKIRVSLRGEIRAIQRQTGITTIYVTDDQEEALSLSDRVAVMRDGRIEQIGTPFEISNRPATPFVASFIGSLNVLSATLVDPLAELGMLSTEHVREPGRYFDSEKLVSFTVTGFGRTLMDALRQRNPRHRGADF
jgi:hypothetical protein